MKPRVLSFIAMLGIFLAALSSAHALPTLPAINTNNLIVVTNPPYNAVGDNATDNAAAIASAIIAAAAGGVTNGLSGGTVRIPAGTSAYLSGPFSMKNNVNLQIEAGALLRMLPLFSYPGGTNATAPFINCNNLHDVEISGLGAIDGQGLPWWQLVGSNLPVSRPLMISMQPCSKVLIQDITLSNSPSPFIAIKGNNNGNVTIQRIIVRAPSSSTGPTTLRSHNTDAIDFAETNGLIQHCDISTGDDNVAMGSSGGLTRDVLITNCAFGAGHGVSIGSFTASGVSNITVINCTFNGTDNPIRMKSDNNMHGGSKGGLVQNLSYLNLGMTNVNNAAIMIYSYYNVVGTPTSITISNAVNQTVDPVGQYTPIWRNITISNITATVAGNGIAGIIWGRAEMPVTNVALSQVNITAAKAFDIYNARQIQFVDSKVTTTTAGQKTFMLWNGSVSISNNVPAAGFVTFEGAGAFTNDSIELFNVSGSMVTTNGSAASPISLGGSTLTNFGAFLLTSSNALNFYVGANAGRMVINGGLTLAGTNNFFAGAGFTNGTYTLMTYTGSFNGVLPVIGARPTNFNYSYALNTNTPGQVKLVVSVLTPTNLVAAPTNLAVNLTWSPVFDASGYNLKRGTSDGGPYPILFTGLNSTNYADTTVTNGVTYYYVVSAIGAGIESSNSLQVVASPLPSNQPANLLMQVSGGQLQVSWPQDHLGWRLQVQTNELSNGLGTNWVTVPNSTNDVSISIGISPTNASVFLRLVYP